MILKNATIINEEFQPQRCDLQIEEGSIYRLGDNLQGPETEIIETIETTETIDLTDCYILPGFIDTHIHGAYGNRISDPNPNMAEITKFEATQGVTGVCITTATSEFDDILRQIDLAVAAATIEPDRSNQGAKIWGIHAEGPFISRKYKGAMNPEYILPPDIEKLTQLQERAKGLLKMITVAPEEEGATELIRYAAEQGLVVSMGHTNATYEQAQAAIEAGATQATHLFNAMRGLHHREPGVLAAALTNPAVRCEMICDHVHLHPAVLQLIYQCKTAAGINIISDSGHAAGLNVTEFVVDGLVRYVKDGVVRLADGTIAGSAKTVLDGVRNLIRSGIPVGEVARMAALNPAKTLKIDHLTGSIAEGKRADLVVLDQRLNVKYTFVGGQCVYKAD